MAKEKTSKNSDVRSDTANKAVVAGKPGFARRQTMVYTVMMALLGSVAYGWFFLFPALALGSVYIIVDSILTSPDYLVIGIASLSTLLGGFMSYRVFCVKVPMPMGVKIDKENAGRIFALVAQLKENYPGLKIDNIIVTDRYEIQIIKTPLWGYPVWSRNTLSIGLPLMLGLPLDHFKVLLMRKMAQFSRKHNLLTNWLYCLRQIMEDYHQALVRNPQLDSQFLAMFFQLYLPVFDGLGVYALQLDELSGDRSALDHINDQDIVLALEMEYLVGRFLDTHYWPKVRQVVEQNPKMSPFGCSRLLPTLESNLPKVNLKSWLMEVHKMSLLAYEKMPNLRQRLDVLGHDKTTPIKLVKGSAAVPLLGDAFYRMLKVVDMFWSKNTADAWRKAANTRRNELAIIQKLERKSAQSRLSIKELMQWRNLQRKYAKQPVALPLYRFLLGKLPKTA